MMNQHPFPIQSQFGNQAFNCVSRVGEEMMVNFALFAVFAFFPEYKAAIILINVIHGVAYAFFFATVYIFVDEFFPKDVRSSAQGLFNLMILGFGPLVANVIGPKLMGDTFKTATGVDFRSLFLVPFGMAVAAAVILLLFFHPPQKNPGSVSTGH